MFKRKNKYKTYSDEQLLQLIAQKKEQAFTVLYDRYANRMHYYFYRMLYQDEERANDFTQDLFLKIIEKASYFDPSKKGGTWIYTLAANMCKNEYRRVERLEENRERHAFNLQKVSQNNFEDLPYVPNAIDKVLFDEQLVLALESLEWTHRECFILRFQEELSIKEISEILQCPEGTVKSRLYYSLKKLSTKLTIFHPKYENQ